MGSLAWNPLVLALAILTPLIVFGAYSERKSLSRLGHVSTAVLGFTILWVSVGRNWPTLSTLWWSVIGER